jgi:DNA-nicking Smr family endonuclease
MSGKPGGRRRRARISEEDRAVWERVIRSATPLRPRSADSEPAGMPRSGDSPTAGPAPAPGPAERRVPAPKPLPRPAAPGLRPVPIGRPEPGLDRRTAERLRRGAREPDARIDLHGLTAERAHALLDAFVRRALAGGQRVLLVITGKGGRHRPEDAPYMAPGRGVLREAAPKWLRTGPHARHIVGIYEAHRRHGGEGAFYVYLKRPR